MPLSCEACNHHTVCLQIQVTPVTWKQWGILSITLLKKPVFKPRSEPNTSRTRTMLLPIRTQCLILGIIISISQSVIFSQSCYPLQCQHKCHPLRIVTTQALPTQANTHHWLNARTLFRQTLSSQNSLWIKQLVNIHQITYNSCLDW
jgi:hypothetical protein